MSLKAFHFFFILIAIFLSVGCAYLGWSSYQLNPESAALQFTWGFSLLAVVMASYGVWFFKKSKKIIV